MTADKHSSPTPLPLSSILQAAQSQQVSYSTSAPLHRTPMSRKRLIEVIDAALRILDEDDDEDLFNDANSTSSMTQDEDSRPADNATTPQ